MKVSTPIGNVFKEVEARFFADKRELSVKRYELMVKVGNEVKVGTITTPLPLDAYLHEHGMILVGKVASISNALPGAKLGDDLL